MKTSVAVFWQTNNKTVRHFEYNAPLFGCHSYPHPHKIMALAVGGVEPPFERYECSVLTVELHSQNIKSIA